MLRSFFFTLISLLLINIASFSQQYVLLDTKTDHPSPIESIALASDGVTMISGHHDGYLVLWDLPTMKMIKKVRGHNNLINTILFEPSGKLFVTAGDDGKVVLWEYPSMKMSKVFQVPPNSNTFAVLSPDASTIFFGGVNSNRVYNSNTNSYNAPYGALYSIDLKGTSKPVVAFDSDQGGYGNKITDGNLDYTGKYVVTIKSYYMYFWNIKTKKLEETVTCPYGLNNFTCTKDAIYVWGDKMIMKLVKEDGKYVVSKSVLAGTRGVSNGYSKLVFSESGKFFVAGDDGNSANIWNTNLEKVQILEGHTDYVRNFLFWNHDSILITGGYDGKIMIWGNKKPQKDTVIIEPIKEVIFTENNVPISIKDRDVELQSTITVSEPEFDIEIWDRSVVDGDSISLNLNGNWILQEYSVVKTKLKIRVKIDPSYTNNYLILYAHNLGEISPNTAAVQVVIDGKEYKLTLSSDLKKSGALNFSYKPK